MFMDQCSEELLSSWLLAINALLPQLFAVTVIWLYVIRLKGFPRSIKQVRSKWQLRLGMILAFSAFAIYGTHSGIAIDTMGICKLKLLSERPISQPIVDLRDTWVLIAGFKGGLIIGLTVGLLAGIESYFWGGFAGASGALAAATIILGLFAGAAFHFRSEWFKSAPKLMGMVIIATCLKYLILFGALRAPEYVKLVSTLTTMLHLFGCLLFIWLLNDLDHDRQERLLQQTELRALKSQIDPHFLNNTLNDLAQIIESDSAKAVEYVCELADFFSHTREFTTLNTIYLELEVDQLKRFLSFKQLGFGDRLQVNLSIPTELFAVPVLSGCLLTLVENSLKHAFKGQNSPYQLFIRAETESNKLLLSVRDNGRGFTFEQFDTLGKAPSNSSNKGSGVALYHLNQRLNLVFGEEACISFSNANGAVVRLKHPISEV